MVKDSLNEDARKARSERPALERLVDSPEMFLMKCYNKALKARSARKFKIAGRHQPNKLEPAKEWSLPHPLCIISELGLCRTVLNTGLLKYEPRDGRLLRRYQMKSR